MKIYGVIGFPVKHSLSPDMHNAAFKMLGIDAEYRKFEVKPEELEDFLLNRKDIEGFNITIPHKVRAKEILESKCEVSEEVKFTGAINTVKREGDKIKCFNTDVSGFGYSLEKDLGFDKTSGKSIFLIGCGGAARAVISYLLYITNRPVAKIYIYDINEENIESARSFFSDNKKNRLDFISSKEDIKSKIKDCQLLVNTSPIGMKEEDGSPMDKELLREDLCVYDVIYNRETQLVKDARSKGAKACTGEGMLAAQGAFAFSYWTGHEPHKVIEVMKKTLILHLR